MIKRVIELSTEVFEKLYEVMKARGFPENPVSESQIISEALEKLHKSERIKKKEEG